MTFAIKGGTTSFTDYVFIQDSTSTTGAGKTGLAFGGITAYYTRAGAAATVISVITQTVTGAWSSGGFVEVDSTHSPGLYRFDVPNAVLAAGVGMATISFLASGAAPVYLKYQIVAYDPNSASNLGLTAIPPVAFGSPGGLFSIVNVTGTAQAGTTNTITLASGASAVDNYYRGQKVILTSATGAGQSAVIIEYNGTTKIAYIGKRWGTSPDATTGYALLHEGSTVTNVARTGIAQGGTGSTLQLDTGASAVDGYYIGSILWIVGGTGLGQSRNINAYTGSTKTASVVPNWVTTPDNTSVFALLPLGIQAATDYATSSALASALAAIITEIDTTSGQVMDEIDTTTGAIPTLVANSLIGDGTITIIQALQIACAAMAGKTSGAGTTTINYRNLADTLNRITATVVVSSGERTAVTTNPS